MLYFLSLDYRLRDISRHNILPFSNILRRILVAVDIALARRRKALKSLQKEIKKSGSTKVWWLIFSICNIWSLMFGLPRVKLIQRKLTLLRVLLINWTRIWEESWNILIQSWGKNLEKHLIDIINNTEQLFQCLIIHSLIGCEIKILYLC